MKKTRFKDCNGEQIYIGDIVSVDQYPDDYVGGSYSYDGIIAEVNGTVCAVYHDIGEEEAVPLSMFPRKGRRIFGEKERYNYWKTALLGGEPPADLIKRPID